MSPASSSRYATLVTLVALLVALARPAAAQQTASETQASLQRWFELDTFTLYSRYHFVENNAGRVTSNTSQYKTSIRGRFNVDAHKRLTINAGAFTGSSFISTWNALGIGPGDFDPHHHYLKQLFVAVVPYQGWEAEYGSLYTRRGEEDEITSYDDDGYLVGARLDVKAPRGLWLDEIVLTHGRIGPFSDPNAFGRWRDPSYDNYGQALLMKRFSKRIAGSLEYVTQSGADAVHAGVTLRLPGRAPVSTIRYEQYRRFDHHAASGFALWADRTVAKIRFQGGYATVDQFYGGWNADRMQNGRRIFGVMQVPLLSGLGLQVFGTRAFTTEYAIPIRRRIDVTINYDVLSALRRTSWF